MDTKKDRAKLKEMDKQTDKLFREVNKHRRKLVSLDKKIKAILIKQKKIISANPDLQFG